VAEVLAGVSSPDRDAQFRHIADLKAEYREAGNPVLSIDTEAKERLGHLYRQGLVWTGTAFQAFDHDLPVGAPAWSSRTASAASPATAGTSTSA